LAPTDVQILIVKTLPLSLNRVEQTVSGRPASV